jgi:hypothetical protein
MMTLQQFDFDEWAQKIKWLKKWKDELFPPLPFGLPLLRISFFNNI